MLSFSEISSCLEMCRIVVENLEVRENIVADGMYDHIFSVDRVNELVREGMPFRDAYAVVAQDIVEGSYQRPEKIRHRHEGSIGNLCLSEIDQLMKQVLYRFKFEQYETRIDSLLK